MRRVQFVFAFLVFLSSVLYGQHNIEVAISTKGPFFNADPDNQLSGLGAHKVIANLKFPNLDTSVCEYAVYISSAELQEIHSDENSFYTGKYQDVRRLSKKWDNRHFRITSELLSNQTLYFEASNLTTDTISVAPVIFPIEKLDATFTELIQESRKGLFFTLIFLGAILLFFIYTIGLTIQTRNPDFKYYSFYLGAILLHNALQADAFLKVFLVFPKNPINYHILNEFLQCFIYVFFMLFIKVFLELKEKRPKLSAFVDSSVWATLGISAAFLLTSIFSKNFIFIQEYLSVLWLVIAGLGTAIVIRVFRKSVGHVRYFIMVGSIFLLIGSFLELFSSLTILGGYNWNLYATPPSGWFSHNYTQLAILLEIVCFALGIGYKVRIQERELSELQQKEIDELKVKEKNVELENLLLEKELTALRSQMNPHFLFNSLSSVNNYIMKENPRKASRYLIKFAKLMRTTLNNSRQQFIYLDKELEALELYVELESMRSSNNFDYEIDMDASLASSQVMIPSMVIQPYVENAIKHGLANLNAKGLLKIYIEQIQNRLKISITDNGIGRKASKSLKTEAEKLRISYGMDITSSRVDLLNKIHELDATVVLKDLKPSGTRVEIILNLVYDGS